MISVALICSGLLACASEVGQKEGQGEEIGSIIGDMLAPYIPGGNTVAGQILQSQAGTIGGLIGGAIGAALDEEDRQALARTTRAAFDSGQAKTFSNPRTGVRGAVKVTGSRVNPGGQQCRTVKQEVRLKDGTALTDNVSACKGPDGWKG